MTANKFLPKLSSVINLDFLPEQLGFIDGGIENIIGKVYLKEVQFVKSNIGDAISVFVVLKIFKKIGYEMPGTGFEILVNAPSGGDPNCLEIPLSFDFQLGILQYVPDFSMESFAFDSVSMFNLMLDILDITEEELLLEAVNICSNGSVNHLVDAINEQYNLSGTSNEINYPTSNNIHQAIQELIISIESANLGIDIFQVIFETCINNPYSNHITTQNINNLFSSLLGNSPIDTLLDLLYPNFHVNLSLSLSIVIPRKVLLPMTVDGVIPPEETEKVVLTFDPGEFNFTSSGSVGFSESVQVSFPPQYPKAQIGKTGLTLTFDYAKIDFSRNSNIAEATAAGYDDDFIGVFINQLGIGLPEKWFNSPDFSTAQIIGRDILIGTGGFSGTIALEVIGNDPNAAVTARLGNSEGFELGFQSFDVVFKQNTIISSHIKGFLKIKGFKDAGGQEDAVIQILGHIGENGDFFITAYEKDGIEAIRIPDILQLNLHSLSIGKRDDRFYVAVSGKLDFDQKSGAIGQFLPKDVEITKLLIWSDGSWEFEGGALVLPTKFTLPMGPVKLSISALHIGSDEREHNGVLKKYKYVGFDGGLSINPAGIDARGDGLKYYFADDGSHHFFRVEGIGIDMILPGNVSEEKAALLFSGYLAVKEGGDNGVEYAGNVAFALPKLNISGSAGMRYLPDVPAFLVDAGLSLSTPIPIGSTGLGIYGFEALFGKHFVVSKAEEGLSEDAPWYEYYKKPERGINRDKFHPIGGTSLGAGVLLGTAGDSGFTHSGRLFFLLSLPGVFFLEGEAQILKKRTGFASNNTPPFYAFLAITNSSIEAALGVDYKMPSSGDIAHIRGAMELGFFFGNSTGWYLNIGRESSEAKRVQAKLLRIINRAYFYLMISSSGIRAGSGAGMDFDRKFGPAKVKIKAYLDQAGRISFRPLQIGGSIQAGIEGSVKIFGVGVGVSAHFGLSVDAPKPFIISGEVRVCVRVIVKKCVNVPFKWVLNENLNVIELPLLESSSVSAINVHTGETYPVAFDTTPQDENVIPLDTYVDIEFKHAVNPLATSGNIGGIVETPIYKELLPPKKSRAPQLTYDFKVVSVDMVSGSVPANVKLGFWQWNAPGHYTKIRLLSLSPLSFMSSGVLNGPSWATDFAVTNMDCVGTTIDEICVDINALNSNGLFPPQTLVTSDGVGFILSGGLSGIVNGSLRFSSGQTLTLYFAEPTATVDFVMATETNGLTIKYYERVNTVGIDYEDVLLEMEDYEGPISEINLNYDNPAKPIQKIVITSGACQRNNDKGGTDPNDLPCSEQIMADLVGLLNGLHKEGAFFPPEPMDVSTPQWIPILYKYLLGDTFNLCTESRECPGAGELLKNFTAILPKVTVEYVPLGENYGEYIIDIPGCIKFNVKIFLSSEYKNQVSCFECLQVISDISTGELIFSGQALLNDGKTRIPVRGCITFEVPYSTYGEIDDCYNDLLKLCYQTLANYQYNELVIETNSLNTVGDDINVISGSVGQVIWEPNQVYDVQVTTQTKVYKDGTTELATFNESHNVRFRTEGPPGFFHKFPGAGGAFHPKYVELPTALQDKFKQRTLLHYIDFANSYPNADGNLINAKPIFFEQVELGLYFERAYVRTMFSGAYQLTLKIKDPAKAGADSDVVFGQWVEGPVVNSSEATVINEVLGEVDCIQVETIQNNSQGAIFVQDLEPLKCYTAIFSASHNGEEREVHRYVFETSRYASLSEMVNSYQIQDEDGLTTAAAFIIEGDWGSVNIPTGNSENVLAYEQAVIGVLGLSDLPPATTTEFLLLKSGNNIIAVLVRNPEPFNNPKMPVSVLETGIDLSINGATLNAKVVAKDSSAILFVGGGNFPTNGLVSIDATFRYKKFNPDTQDYDDDATESISFSKQF